ncbi:MAG: ATP-dependent protease LonB [Bacillota bacterium]|nr:ATP-dependent protease LonB [Bacillota bacterium]
MQEVLLVVQLFFSFIIGLYFLNLLINSKSSKSTINRDSEKEMDRLNKMREIKLTEPLSEKSRPKSFDEIIGQKDGIKALEAAICGPNPQHVIIYGPPGVGKTAAARLVLEKAKKTAKSPFGEKGRFIEIDATTIRFDDRGMADPLIGSVHDPIYQGAGALGIAGIPQPKEGAVTKAHGGILFIDEIGELHPIEMNKLLKVLEDRKVFLDSAYYSSEDNNIPVYIKEIFENGYPADFRLIGATTKSPDEIPEAIRSRCVEVYFRSLDEDEIIEIVKNAAKKINMFIEDKGIELISKYAGNGREAVNIVQLASSLVINEDRNMITLEDIEWVIENGKFPPRITDSINEEPKIGIVNGLAVSGANQGRMMKIEAITKKLQDKSGSLIITGVAEKEEIKIGNSTIIRKSSIMESAYSVLTVLKNTYNIDISCYDIHLNFQGGQVVDGPSAGVSIAAAIYSSIKGIKISNKIAMTGEISISGSICPVGGVYEKITAAKKAGCIAVIIPKDNYQAIFSKIEGIKIITAENIEQVFISAFINDICPKRDMLSAKRNVI